MLAGVYPAGAILAGELATAAGPGRLVTGISAAGGPGATSLASGRSSSTAAAVSWGTGLNAAGGPRTVSTTTGGGPR